MLPQNHLTLNVLNFSFVQEKLCCFITKHALEGAVLLSQKDTEFFVHYLKLPAETVELYSTFDIPCEEGIPLMIECSMIRNPIDNNFETK